MLDQFIAADLDISVLPHLNDHDLQVCWLQAYCRQALAIAQTHACKTDYLTHVQVLVACDGACSM